jgi:uncharacterized membrane protein YoaK (UPF0700 family)
MSADRVHLVALSRTVNDDEANARHLALRLGVVLAFGAGAMDAITFSRLGDVFAGVMTGNMVLLGLAIGNGKAVVTGRVAVALASFAVGVLVAGGFTRGSASGAVWSRRVTRVLMLESGVILVFALGWQVSGGSPAGSGQALLLAGAAFAMGLQSGAVVAIGVPGLSTTYLTGTLTGFMTSVAHSAHVKTEALFLIAALLSGAVVAAIAITQVPRLAPALPLLAVAAAVATALRSPRLGTDHTQ